MSLVRSRRGGSLALATLALSAALGACRDAPTRSGPKLEIAPAAWMGQPGATQQFTVTLDGRPVTGVTWSVDGPAGSGAALGTVTESGAFTLPASAPSPNLAMVRATVASRGSAAAPVSVLSARQPGTWLEWEPRVVNPNSKDPLTLTVYTEPSVTRVALEYENGATVDLEKFGARTYRVAVPAATAMRGYKLGTLHHLVGTVDLYASGTRVAGHKLFVNVRDRTVPPVATRSLGADMQASPHLINIRFDSLYFGNDVPPAVTKRIYSAFGDEFDFLAVVAPATTLTPRYLRSVRNGIRGIGQVLFDEGARYGSPQRLEGIVHYPDAVYFDLADHHELGHRWANHLRHPLVSPSVHHWPLSSLARGLVGVSVKGTKLHGHFPYRFAPQANGDFVLMTAPVPTEYNDLELYLMGLLPPDSVAPHFVFRDQAQAAGVTHGGRLKGPVDSLRVSDVVAVDGPRVPATAQAPKSFRVGSVVLSMGRLLTQDEMAFFDLMAARGEATTELTFTNADGPSKVKPFHLATRRKARLVTALP